MAACWRELAARPEVDLHVIAFQAGDATAFSDRMMEGIPCTLLDESTRNDKSAVRAAVARQQPDVLVLSGWFHPPYRRLPFLRAFRNAPCIMGMDTPWQGTLRQQVGRLVLQPFMRQMERVVVTGERSWQYARRLGVSPGHIVRGLYGVDYAKLAPLWKERTQDGWPQSFLFIGRYAEEKAIDVLTEAYRIYRTQIANPWPLHCCGKGPNASLLDMQQGIVNHGFVQPDALLRMWRQAGAFVLPSRFDPWPLALVEAAATGLPIACTDACGSAVELVRDRYNGRIVPTGSASALAEALLELHGRSDELPEWGQRSQQFAAPYSARAWAQRWEQISREVQNGSHSQLMNDSRADQ